MNRRNIGGIVALTLLGSACASEPQQPAVTPVSAQGPAAPPLAAAPVAAPPAAAAAATPGATGATGPYAFAGGYPTPDTVRRAYDDADLARAVDAYKFFFPTVSWAAGWATFEKLGLKTNHSAGYFAGTPKQLVFTPNADTPYAIVPLDLSAGPVVVELPPGPLICVANDLNQRWVADLGLPGPDAGKGGKHLLVPPGYKDPIPKGYFAATPTTNRVSVAIRAIPLNGDMAAAIERIKTVKVHPLKANPAFTGVDWVDFSERTLDGTSNAIENDLKFWQVLHEVINTEPAFEAFRMNYGALAELGIQKGKPFAPDSRMKAILTKAAELANAQMRVQSFADRRPERMAWTDRQWEWASLRSENGTFDLPAFQDLGAREKWFYQAILESPAMFRRDAGAGSLYWLAARDKTGAYLDGKKTYKLSVPLPVPGKLFWSVTIYDPETRGQILTSQGKAALRSLVELKDLGGAKTVDLYFGPKAPAGQEARFIQTLPNKGFFAYFRIYGPEKPAFDGSWKPGDFEEVK